MGLLLKNILVIRLIARATAHAPAHAVMSVSAANAKNHASDAKDPVSDVNDNASDAKDGPPAPATVAGPVPAAVADPAPAAFAGPVPAAVADPAPAKSAPAADAKADSADVFAKVLDKLSREKASLFDRCVSLEQDLKASKKKIKALEASEDKLTESLKDSNEKIDSLKQALEDSKEALKDSETEAKEIKEKFIALHNDVDQVVNEYRSVAKALTAAGPTAAGPAETKVHVSWSTKVKKMPRSDWKEVCPQRVSRKKKHFKVIRTENPEEFAVKGTVQFKEGVNGFYQVLRAGQILPDSIEPTAYLHRKFNGKEGDTIHAVIRQTDTSRRWSVQKRISEEKFNEYAAKHGTLDY